MNLIGSQRFTEVAKRVKGPGRPDLKDSHLVGWWETAGNSAHPVCCVKTARAKMLDVSSPPCQGGVILQVSLRAGEGLLCVLARLLTVRGCLQSFRKQ